MEKPTGHVYKKEEGDENYKEWTGCCEQMEMAVNGHHVLSE